MRLFRLLGLVLLILLAATIARRAGAQGVKTPVPDAPYLMTPDEVVDEMLKIAHVGSSDVVYDLGCGDGRIVIAAAEKFGARGVGIDIDEDRIFESRRNAEFAEVQDRVQFIQQDLFKADLSGATVITLYLLPEVNMRLRPKLLGLRPGTRIVSHAYDMGDWKPERTEHFSGRWIYYWTVPTKAEAEKLGLLP